MAGKDCQTLQSAIGALAAGRFDDVSTDQMAVLEAHLNECADCAARLADVRARLALPFDVAVDSPAPEAWDIVWRAIEAGPSGQAERAGLGRGIRWRWWAAGAMAAVAAILLIIGLWPMAGTVQPLPEVQFASADDVHIESLSVFDQGTPMVLSVGEDGGISVIWVVEGQES
jgi:anti-sigma-K factor RskA